MAQDTGYHVTRQTALDFVAAKLATGNNELEVKFYPDRHNQYPAECDHGVWHTVGFYWVYVTSA